MRRRHALRPAAPEGSPEYWALTADQLLARIGSGPGGLSEAEARTRLERVGPNLLSAGPSQSRTRLLSAQLRSPLVLLLVFAAIVSALTGEWIDAVIVILIVVASVGIGYSREWSAQQAVAALQAQVRTKATVVRDGHKTTIPVEEVVPGDIAQLSAGCLVPGDARSLEAADLFVSEAALTGESFPVEKRAGEVPVGAPLRDRANCVFLGTNVRSGVARCLVVRTGPATEFGAVAERLSQPSPETEFDRGLRRFGYLLTTAMLALVLLVFAATCSAGGLPWRPCSSRSPSPWA